MKYKLDHGAQFKHSGTILDCSTDGILDPNHFVISSRMTNMQTGETHTVKVRKSEGLVEFSLPEKSLQKGSYEWVVYLKNSMVSWVSPTVIVEVA